MVWSDVDVLLRQKLSYQTLRFQRRGEKNMLAVLRVLTLAFLALEIEAK